MSDRTRKGRAGGRGSGLVNAAAAALLAIGLLNIAGGIGALVAAGNFDSDALPAGELSLWAVLLLGLGAIDLVVAKLVLDRNPLGAVAAC